MPAASPAALHRAAPRIPESGPRPSGLGPPLPPSEPTLRYNAPARQSDPTIEEAAPPLAISIGHLPISSGGPTSPVPTTVRLTGTGTQRVGAPLEAASQHAQAYAETLALYPLELPGEKTRPLIAVPRAEAGHDDAILTLPIVLAPPALAPRRPVLYRTPVDRETGSGLTKRPVDVLPPPPGPASLRVRRWSGRVVLLSLVLIAACAGIGAWLLLHKMLPWPW